MTNTTTPKTRYTNSLTPKYGGSTLSAPKKKPGSKVVWGIPKSGAFPSAGSGKTANSTSPYPTGVNSPNPTAGVAPTSSPGATGTQQGSNAPAVAKTGSSLPQSGQDFAATLAGIQKQAAGIQTAFSEYKSSEGADDSAYLKYKRGLENPAEASAAQKSRDESAKRLAEIQSKREEAELEARRVYEETLDKPGGTVAHAQQAATLSRRRSNQELADIALQESAAGRSALVAQGIYESELGQDRKLSLEEAQSLGLPFGTTMSEARLAGITPSAAGGVDGVSSLAQMVMSGEMDMAGVPTDLRGAVAEAVQAGGGVTDQTNQISPYQQERITRNLNSIDDLVGQVSGWTTGMGSLIAAIPGTPAADFRADVNTLSANIAFGELTAMREASKTGGALGQVSERELALLEAALGSLDRAQSPEQFKKSLDTVKASIERWQAAVEQHGGGETGGGDGGLYDF